MASLLSEEDKQIEHVGHNVEHGHLYPTHHHPPATIAGKRFEKTFYFIRQGRPSPMNY